MKKITITSDTLVMRNSDMLTSKMDGEIVMMSIENGEYYGLDLIGSKIWELMENPLQVNEIIEQLLAEYDVDPEECSKDTIEFLRALTDRNLIIFPEQD